MPYYRVVLNRAGEVLDAYEMRKGIASNYLYKKTVFHPKRLIFSQEGANVIEVIDHAQERRLELIKREIWL